MIPHLKISSGSHGLGFILYTRLLYKGASKIWYAQSATLVPTTNRQKHGHTDREQRGLASDRIPILYQLDSHGGRPRVDATSDKQTRYHCMQCTLVTKSLHPPR